MTLSRAYEEVIDFIAAGTTSDSIAAFTPSEETFTACGRSHLS